MSTDLAFWLKHIESFHPAEIELGLERIRLVAKRLSLLSLKAKTILVGGTNGKGSCVAMLESLALSDGKRVACYTSPHLLEFNERIRVNGQNIDDLSLVRAFQAVEAERGEVALTFFEFTTLAAFYIFAEQPLDLIVLEVGLGGRKDATNIIEPDVSVITSVDYDHLDWLGKDLTAIAYEKAGILRENRPGIIGDQATFDLVQQATNAHFKLSLAKLPTADLAVLFDDAELNPNRLLTQNLMAAIEAYSAVSGVSFKGSAGLALVKAALEKLELAGRFQTLAMLPGCQVIVGQVIVDVAHNPQSAENLRYNLSRLRAAKASSPVKVVALCGMMADKALEQVLTIMDPVIDNWCFVDLPVARAIKAKDLNQRLFNCRLTTPSACYSSVEAAFEQILTQLKDDDILIVFGSFITVANMLQYWKQNYADKIFRNQALGQSRIGATNGQ